MLNLQINSASEEIRQSAIEKKASFNVRFFIKMEFRWLGRDSYIICCGSERPICGGGSDQLAG